MFAYRSLPEVLRYQSWEPKSLDEVQSFIKKNAEQEFNAAGWYQIGIALESDDTLIGDCGINILDYDWRMAEFGITIAPSFQSRGYATEALNAILALLFDNLSKHRVLASVDPRNIASMALMKKLGLRQEAHFVKSLYLKNEWVDDVLFAMLAAEWCAK